MSNVMMSAICKALFTSRNFIETSDMCTLIGPEHLLKAIETPGREFLLIDSRSQEEFSESHIPDAINIPERKLEALCGLLPSDKNFKLVFYCNGLKCGKSARSAQHAASLGYNNIEVFAEGMPVWEEKGYPFYKGPGYSRRIETTKMTPTELARRLASAPGGITVVDVCDREEFAQEHIEGAINLPLAAFASGSGVLDKNKDVVVYCKSGGRSNQAYRKLLALDFKKTYQMILDDWKAAGLPLATLSITPMPSNAEPGAVADGQVKGSTAKVSATVVIDRPIGDVFKFTCSAHNWHRFVPGLTSVGYNTAQGLASGSMFTWTYCIRGVDVHGSGQVIDLVDDKTISIKMHTLLPILKTVRFISLGHKTLLEASVSYDSPGRVTSIFFDVITKRLNRKDASSVLEQIKTLCEGADNPIATQEAEGIAPRKPNGRLLNAGAISSAMSSAFL